MIGPRVLICGATLAVAASIAVPAAQAAVPPIKAFPIVFFNGVRGINPKPTIAAGELTLHAGTIGNVTCNTDVMGQAHIETTEGSEKGLLNTVGYNTYECKSAKPCKVKNTKGEEVEGTYATAEAPPEPAGTEAHETGISSLPWTGEFIERETEKRQVLMKHVKVWIVFPPNTVGTGSGCLGTEVEAEDREGKTEKEEGYELAPQWISGTHNGLKPSYEEFLGEEGLTEKGFPITGRLFSPQVGPVYLTATRLVSGGLGGGWELVFPEVQKPWVRSVEPLSGLESGGTTVRIFGEGFTGATGVSFGETSAKSFTVEGYTAIAAVSPAGTGTVDVTVTAPGGTTATSPRDRFTYSKLVPPTVTNVEPKTGPEGTTVTITGTNFTGASGVSFGTTSALRFTVNSDTSITAIVAIVNPAERGKTVNVTVTTPAGTSAISAADQFTFSK